MITGLWNPGKGEGLMEHITHDVTATWHVFAGGVWQAQEYAGYAPVNVWVGERIVPVVYRHMDGSAVAECGLCNP